MKFLFILIGLFFSQAAFSAGYKIECQKMFDDVVGYCVHQPQPLETTDVLFHFHGSGGSEQLWKERYYPEQLREYWKSHGLKQPIVVSISFGPIWLVSEKNSSDVSGILEMLRDEIIPAIEKKHGLSGRRLALGESMGGFNVLQLAMKTKLFSRAAILCAPVTDTIHPFSSEKEISQFVMNTYAGKYYSNGYPDLVPQRVKSSLELAKAFFPTLEEWNRANPFNLVLSSDTRSLPEFYFAAGMIDEYALYEGNEKLTQFLRSRNAKVEWRPQWGGHCVIDIPSLGEFLAD